MAQNITLMGASYSDVPAVTLPKTGGGTARFTDTSDATAIASDVAQGKYFYGNEGVRTLGTRTGGGGGIVLASGTFTGTGTWNATISIGEKMAQTDFFVRIMPENGSEFPYDNKYKYTVVLGMLFSNIGYYDLSTDGTDKDPISSFAVTVDNSGTISTFSTNYISARATVRYTSVAASTINTMKITKNSSGFSIKIGQNNSAYAFASGITYNYEVIYFGSNPSTDIVEVA